MWESDQNPSDPSAIHSDSPGVKEQGWDLGLGLTLMLSIIPPPPCYSSSLYLTGICVIFDGTVGHWVWTVGHCDGTVGHCDGTVGNCNWTVGNWTVGHCDGTLCFCDGTVRHCDGTLVLCEQTWCTWLIQFGSILRNYESRYRKSGYVEGK